MIRRWLLNKVLARVFHLIREEDVLKWLSDKKTFQVGNRVLPPDVSNAMIEEAVFITSTSLWEYLIADIKREACKKIYLDSLDFDQVMGGKMALWVVDVLEKKLENIKKLR